MRHAFASIEQNPYDRIADVAERLFADIGFQKTTIGDIAHELRMSPANVYRFFASKAEINNEVGRRLLAEIEAAVHVSIDHSASPSEKLRATIATIEKLNAQRFLSNQKLHELIERAFTENWPLVRDHVQKLDKLLTKIISQGQEEGVFHVEDCALAALLVRSACLRFYHPRILVEYSEEPEPTLDQMIEFCLAALA
jgi:AcrR family transcriptional regulator